MHSNMHNVNQRAMIVNIHAYLRHTYDRKCALLPSNELSYLKSDLPSRDCLSVKKKIYIPSQVFVITG